MQSEQRSKEHVTLGFSLVHELNDSTLRMCQYVLWSERTVLTYCRMHGDSEERKLSVQPALISMADYTQLSKTNSLDPNPGTERWQWYYAITNKRLRGIMSVTEL